MSDTAKPAPTLLAVNAGSSSIKLAVYAEQSAQNAQPKRLLSALVEGIGSGGAGGARFSARRADGSACPGQQFDAGSFSHADAFSFLLDWIAQECGDNLLAAGHRVVHGGERFTQPARIDDDALAALEQLIPLAPLHQPHNLAAIRALRELRPALPQVACFDTAFHRSQPPVAQMFALPRAVSEQGVKRYGFHGLSYEYISGAMPPVLGEAARGRVIVAHLGNGASLCAMRDGMSVATTMGFSTLDGLVMGTRGGNLDPGVLLYLLRQGYDAASLERLLYHESGLLGVSGVSADMRDLLASAEVHAQQAIELFCYRIAREIGSLAAALGGVDALVFTGGIGEHAAEVRGQVCKLSAWLDIALDESANAAGGPRISSPAGKVSAWVIATDEEAVIVRSTQAAIA